MSRLLVAQAWLHTKKNRVQVLWPGVSLSAVVATAALFLSEHYQAPVMLFALLLGMALNFLSKEARSQPGIEFVAKEILRWGVALLGLKITADQVQTLGWQPVLMVVLAVTCTIVLGIVMAKWMGFKTFFGFLSGGSVAICGASAALAIATAFPNHPQKDRATLFVVISVSTLSTIAMVSYPILVGWLGLDPVQAGVFLGGTIHDVAQVVAAGMMMGQESGDVATVVKLFRVVLLLPVVMLIAFGYRKWGSVHEAGDISQKKPPLVPGFLMGFMALVILASTGWIPTEVTAMANSVSRWCLVIAIAASGVKTSLGELAKLGLQPVLMLVVETLVIACFVLSALLFMNLGQN